MSLNEILNGLQKVLNPYIDGIGRFLRILFTTPEIAGISLGGWFFFFACLSIIAGVFFDV